MPDSYTKLAYDIKDSTRNTFNVWQLLGDVFSWIVYAIRKRKKEMSRKHWQFVWIRLTQYDLFSSFFSNIVFLDHSVVRNERISLRWKRSESYFRINKQINI